MSLVDLATSTATVSVGPAVDDSVLDRKFVAFTGNIFMVGSGSIGQGVIPYVPWVEAADPIASPNIIFCFCLVELPRAARSAPTRRRLAAASMPTQFLDDAFVKCTWVSGEPSAP